MLQPWILEMIVREHIETLKAEAESARLPQELRTNQTPLPQRAIVAIGGLLVAAGTFLQNRYAPIPYTPPETDCAPC